MFQQQTATGRHGGGGRGGRGGGGRRFRRRSSFFIRPTFSSFGWPGYWPYGYGAYYAQLLAAQQLAAQQQLLAAQAGDPNVTALEQAIEALTNQLAVLQGQLAMLTGARPAVALVPGQQAFVRPAPMAEYVSTGYGGFAG